MDKVITGSIVKIKYLDIDDIEAKCWLIEEKVVGYLCNINMNLKLSHIGKEDYVAVSSTFENDIRLVPLSSLIYLSSYI